MEFVETPTFTRLINKLLPDDDYRILQNELIHDPARGILIQGSGGIRKLRFSRPGAGKSSGIRVIYYWFVDDNVIFMLLVYQKSKKDNLSDLELAALRDLVKEL